jgi:hypothetical protein
LICTIHGGLQAAIAALIVVETLQSEFELAVVRASIAIVQVAVVALLDNPMRRVVVADAVAADLLAADRRARLRTCTPVAVLTGVDDAIAAVLELAVA